MTRLLAIATMLALTACREPEPYEEDPDAGDPGEIGGTEMRCTLRARCPNGDTGTDTIQGCVEFSDTELGCGSPCGPQVETLSCTVVSCERLGACDLPDAGT